ncbi:serine hydrolase domain-containing protein [Lacipirellula limnantheis]|uniref:Penicillin-binding protein 4 n=1 Tax=Lacipirellula limnantheis TaxID=2528024 RepID=A0A517U2E8_9BACT|nr:serine hydrolase domain-containing protein [Lacipirellula limnantheis]QDT74805.1 Penicillin-binding protein 4* [Lacipirellula limnantheis]
MNYQPIVESELATFAPEHQAPHIVAAICRDGELLAAASQSAAGFGALAEPAAASFRIASMTKSFAAAAVLRLRDEGRLRVENCVADYVPELRLKGPWWQVTVGQLLGMRSGLPATDDPWADRKASEPASFLNAELLEDVQFSDDAGEDYQYSNLGYMLIGRVISNVAGVSALEYIANELLRPLGMGETGWNFAAGRGVEGHRRVADGFQPETALHVTSDVAVFAGLCTTLRDLAKWVGFFTDAHGTGASRFEEVLAASSRREMERCGVVLNPGASIDGPASPAGYGYGLRANFIGEEWVVGHSGGLPGYGSHMSWSPTRGIGVIALGNVTYYPASKLCKEMWLETQERAGRAIVPLARGGEIAASRGRALVEAVLRGGDALPAELFTYNVPLDENVNELWGRLREALAGRPASTIEVRVERGLAGAICAEGKPLVFFSLAPAEGQRIQKVGFYGEPA